METKDQMIITLAEIVVSQRRIIESLQQEVTLLKSSQLDEEVPF